MSQTAVMALTDD